MKNAFDRLLALILMIALMPILLAVAVVIRLRLGKPILFRQKRPGYRGKIFVLYKFRTMCETRDANGSVLPDNQRLTRLGKILRQTSLDELPQLFNVLTGDLSFVGPRPLLLEYLPLYSPEQARRHDVKPGITGWAQVNGRNAISWARKFELDVWYVDNHCFWLDIRILWLTFSKVFLTHNVSAEGHVTMPKFTGNEDLKNE